MRRFLGTYVMAALAVVILVSDLFTNINPLLAASKLFEHVARNHVYTLFTAFLGIVVGLCADAFVSGLKAKRETEIQDQRLSAFKATMRTVQNIVNNALNELQLFRLDVETVLPQESLTLFDDIVERTAAKLKALGDLESTSETLTPFGHSIDYEPPPAG